ncbi:MAG TPA: GNAT family N-acetyltransferase [Thermoplasmata archaeon]|nr:GNAT family N-acetyltransferase [Thermoplasmata archaeon]
MSPPIEPGPHDPARRARLHASLRRALIEAYPHIGLRQADALDHQAGLGYFDEVLWTSGSDGREGFAWVQRQPSGLRVLGLWLDPMDGVGLAAMLADLERAERLPIATVTDLLPGLDDRTQAAEFPPNGYWHRSKVGMRRPSTASAVARPDRPEIRPVRRADLEALVGVYARAYSHRPDEFWTWTIPHPWEEARRDVLAHWDPAGRWSDDFVPEASMVWDSGGQVLGGLLTTRGTEGEPHVDDLIVEPAHHRRGIGRALLERSIFETGRRGPTSITLAAIGNGAPYRLYRSVGFEDVPGPEGRLDGHWVRGPSPF